jgi:adenosylcobinamide kinase/adenosylcobinamide-phosphate guanylyltransferase
VTIVVTNEVGSGIVPAFPLGRLYRDILGRANQLVAARAAAVYLVVAGIGVDLRRLEAGLAD